MTTTRRRTGTRLAVVGPSVVVLLALGASAVALGPRLPDQVASHFGADGRADAWSSPWPFWWIAAGLAVAAVVVTVLALRMRDRRTAALVVLVTACIAPVAAVAWIATALIAVRGGEEFSPWWTVLFLALAAASAAVSVPAVVRGAPPVPAYDVTPLTVAPDARVAWRSRVGSTWMTVLGAVVVVAGVATAVWTAPSSSATTLFTGVVVLLAGLAVLVLARVEVTVDHRGLRLTSTWTRLPLMRVPLARIASCGWEQVSPGQWGGWGYRISGRGIAYVTRSGPGLVARLENGQARMVTVDDAERGAAALGALLAARDAT